MTPIKIAGYLAHAQSAGYKKRVRQAKDLIAAHPDYGVSVSWGKDSLCVLHLALSVHGHAKAVHGRYSSMEELPDIPSVRDAFLSIYGKNVEYIETPLWGDWELYHRAGRFFLSPETKAERQLLAEWHNQIRQQLDDAMQSVGAKGKIIGLAAHESHGRKMNIVVRGSHYQSSDESMPKLLPIAHWHPADVWAYMLTHDLPRLKIYDAAKDPERARSEFAFAVIGKDAADAIRRHGAWREWADCYPDFWSKWVMQWPVIRDIM